MTHPAPGTPELRTLSDLRANTDEVVALANDSGNGVIITRHGQFLARIDGIAHLDMEEIAGLGIFTEAELDALAARTANPDLDED